jgi:hypothetical protein
VLGGSVLGGPSVVMVMRHIGVPERVFDTSSWILERRMNW